ncbi:MAG: TetR/AcrR family transcriptional regulator [Eubacteriales bacterium]|nr:TetR/AcrR family transcriptional regulator [Eubacteriales bacterium]
MNGHKRQREESAKMIETALFELLKEKDFAQITVSGIVKRADVARRTFYRLYKGKEDVIDCYFSRLCQNYRSTYPALEKYDLDQIARDYFGFWYQYREFLMVMNQCGLREKLYYEISRVSEEIVKNRISCKEVRNGQEVRYFAYYSAGGFILLLHHWIIEGMRETPDEYAQKVSRAISQFIAPFFSFTETL